MNRRRLLWGILLAATAGLPACETKKVEIPDLTGPSEATGNVRVGIPTMATPSPTPEATPTPGPGPTPGPSASCSLPPGSGSGNNCQRTTPVFLDAVDAGIEQVLRESPEFFDLNDSKCSGCYRILDGPHFTDRLVQILGKKGLCAMFDGEELAVKNSNDFNEQYDLNTADGYLRRGDGSYRSTCRPAWF